ncbi:TlpA family protein disulfide reductase [Burkholderia glumae]|uniref:TlpA family protein disulfide reductase n=1 Tax=Burkholderia glumae TaxID=337 RepID=A0AAQ0BSM8_BURGL|nr:TlpA disulfide reductase family protein [Burkholderia glumae]ACR27705.1 Redoxin [Burkholderia glumae BGR1]AJY65626.1 ahpC/TSA family protein [Burkholderia glumae LMG 2196 = ATCC 33617]KHJ62568.1 redoxin [Burkholderia glumae]MCM2481315.1 TlpA family protein disulfide reductase [Burkholderia glumae]MCM2508545.1 TlpA family protein disulfide reductase [Burkholderia glumae]
MNSKRLVSAAVAAVAIAGGLAAGHWVRGDAFENTAEAAPVGDPVSALWAAPVTDPDGKPQSLASFKGQKVVVNFWASWCGPCVKEMPELVALSHEYRQKGIRFVGVGVDSGQNVKAFLQKVKVDYPVVVSGYAGADLARNFGNTAGALPFTVVIDANGKVRMTKLGEIQPDALKKTLDTL